MDKKEIDFLLKIALELDYIIPLLDKIESGFDDDIEKMALSMLLFYSEEKILDRLANLRTVLYLKLEHLLGKEALYDIFETSDESRQKYKIKYDLSKEEMKKEILNHLVLFKPYCSSDEKK